MIDSHIEKSFALYPPLLYEPIKEKIKNVCTKHQATDDIVFGYTLMLCNYAFIQTNFGFVDNDMVLFQPQTPSQTKSNAKKNTNQSHPPSSTRKSKKKIIVSWDVVLANENGNLFYNYTCYSNLVKFCKSHEPLIKEEIAQDINKTHGMLSKKVERVLKNIKKPPKAYRTHVSRLNKVARNKGLAIEYVFDTCPRCVVLCFLAGSSTANMRRFKKTPKENAIQWINNGNHKQLENETTVTYEKEQSTKRDPQAVSRSDNHWILVCINNECEAHAFEPFISSQWDESLRGFLDDFVNSSVFRNSNLFEPTMKQGSILYDYKTAAYRYDSFRSAVNNNPLLKVEPFQNNGTDCGYWLCLFAQHVLCFGASPSEMLESGLNEHYLRQVYSASIKHRLSIMKQVQETRLKQATAAKDDPSETPILVLGAKE
jgi:hypothetical protein